MYINNLHYCTLPSAEPVAVRMGRKFRLSVHRKNEERKKKIAPKLIVSIQLDSVSLTTASSGVLSCQSSRDCSSTNSFLQKRKHSFVVSVQRDAVSVMTVSLPSECYRMVPAPSLGVLMKRLLTTNSIPAGK